MRPRHHHVARDDEEEDDDSRDSDADFIFVHFWGYRLPSLGPSDTNQITNFNKNKLLSLF